MTTGTESSATERRRIPKSDWWIELVVVPLALASIVAALWGGAYSSGSGPYYAAALMFGIIWWIVIVIIDVVRSRHRAVLLLSLPLTVAGILAGFGIAELALARRGVVEACPVGSSQTYQVRPSRGGSYWETSQMLECERGRVEVISRASGPEDPLLDEYDSLGDEPETVLVRYDPLGLVPPETENIENTRSYEPLLYGAAAVALFGMAVRLIVVVARSHGR